MGSFAQGALIQQLTSTATSGGTTTLTASSTTWQRFTGTSDETVVLPDATTMKDGRSFTIENRSSGELTVQFNGGAEAAKIASGTERSFNLYDNSSSAGDWVVGTQIDLDQPLAIHATRPTPDNVINIEANQIQGANGTISSIPPVEDLLNSYAGATIDFQTSTATGGTSGTIYSEGSPNTFTRPNVTVGEYVRLVFSYVSAATPYVNTKFSSASATEVGLENPGSLFAAIDGLALGYVDLESTAAYNFKTIGAGTNVILNEKIYQFGSGAGAGGAGGDDSFKVQSVATDGTTTIKGGYLGLADGREIATYDGSGSASTDFGGDITIDLDNLVTSPSSNTSYYLYVDVTTLASSPTTTSDTGRELHGIQEANFAASTTAPEDINLYRYVPIGVVRYATSNWDSGVAVTYSTKKHPLSILASGLEYTKDYTTINDVGTADQIRAGHILTTSSFTSSITASTISFYNLDDANDDSGNARNLTNNGSTPFTATGVTGASNTAASLTAASSQYFSSTDAHFNPGDTDFTVGGWFYANDWTPGGAQALMDQWVAADESWYLVLNTSGTFTVYGNTGSVENTNINAGTLSGWNHLILRYTASSNTFELFVNALNAGSLVLTGNLLAASSPNFQLGAVQSGNFFNGDIDEFIMINGTALSDNEIAKLYSNKISHNAGLAASDQTWLATIKNSDFEIPVSGYIVDKDLNDLYVDFSAEDTTSQVQLKLVNNTPTGRVGAVRSRRYDGTAATIDGLLPITHGLPEKPTHMELWVESSGYWELHDAGSYFKVSDTQIASTGTTLTSVLGGSANVLLIASVGAEAVYSPSGSGWTTFVTATSANANSGEEHLVNTTGGTVTITLPASPSLGHRVRVIDFNGNFGTNACTIDRNGNNIQGAASNLTLSTNGDVAELIFNGSGDWRRLI